MQAQLAASVQRARRSLQGGLSGLRPGVQAGLQGTHGRNIIGWIDAPLSAGELGACVLISKARGRGAYFM